MGKIRKNEVGFSPVEVILVLIILALIGVVGWFVYENHNKTNTPSSTTSASTTKQNTSVAKVADPYAGWNTYKATIEPVSFKYPSSWTVDNSTGNAPIRQANREFVRLSAPVRSISGIEYQFSFIFDINIPSGIGPSFPVASSTKLTDANFPLTLYALALNFNGSSSSPNYGKSYSVEISTTNYQPGSSTDGNDRIQTSPQGRVIDMGGTYTQQNNNTLAYFIPSQFVAQQEVQQAEQVFSSLAQY
jgi:hypothetical protein